MNKEFYLVSISSTETNAVYKHIGLITDLSQIDKIKDDINRDICITFNSEPFVCDDDCITYQSVGHMFSLDIEKVKVID